MGKLDLIKGQPVYLADKSKKRKKPQESDPGENPTEYVGKVKKPRKPRKPRNITAMEIDPSQPWRVLNRGSFVNSSTSTIPTFSTLPPTIGVTAVTGGSGGPGSSLPTDPLRPAKKAKISTSSTLASTGDNVCPLCGGSKHQLRDCLAPKGGVEK